MYRRDLDLDFGQKQHQSSRAAVWRCMQHRSFWKHTTLHAPRHSIYCMGVKNVGLNTSSTTRNAFLSSIDCEHRWCSGVALEATWSYHQAGSNWQTPSSLEILLLGILLVLKKSWTSGSPPGRDGQSQKTKHHIVPSLNLAPQPLWQPALALEIPPWFDNSAPFNGPFHRA